MSLFWRIFSLNAAVLTVAALVLLFAPVTVSSTARLAEALIILAGTAVTLVANAAMLRVGLAPLARLTRVMTTIDLLKPGTRLAPSGQGEIAALITAFNSMLERLETERASSAGRALSAQEAERHRIAQELHDEIGQTLTAVLLDLKRVAKTAPEAVRDQLLAVQESTRNALDEIRRIARRLRPGVLDELGLGSALRALAGEFTTAGMSVRRQVSNDLPVLPKDVELVVYRVAQESLTNAARHSAAQHVDLVLSQKNDELHLCVRDDGRGLRGAAEGAGIRGMRERALLIGAGLTVESGTTGGTSVHLRVPT
ncbi:histidine kinase [Paractinoplanes abujensis]|uniref:histidine kinase n=1 Tax=Paractinoplanes abujensis TaxID=882441 RepID=A0A7W7CPG9_9ACTN|nr:sensor histidine kinase [Actinoplanes abujensis]MBB4692322.1 two-component system sensor histidine kinase UhpB [Actinoplanes abujensis]GID24200.1 histidine kinase [Actinoplanes abujensis]